MSQNMYTEAQVHGMIAAAVASSLFEGPPNLSGAQRIAVERARQIIEEGYTTNMDATLYKNDELTVAASIYLIPAKDRPENLARHWPFTKASFKPKNAIRDLERAGAFIAAEIDRRLALGEK